jgi:RNA polymerase primary sigma factor
VKSTDEAVFAAKMKGLMALAKKKKRILDNKDIEEQLSDIELDQEQIDKVYDYLESQGIDVVSNIDLKKKIQKIKNLIYLLQKIALTLMTM